ncbi:MAG: Fe-S cluster assembly protein SufD [Rhodobacteraceae bacterium]|nr:Fe-S cluster assembly protein SufD [Paracoccaceae bacterium]
MKLAQAKTDAAEARVNRSDLPAGGKWANEARLAALTRLHGAGLPGRRDEYWRFTRPDDLNRADAPAADLLKTGESPVFGDMDRLKLVFVDGVLDRDLSDAMAMQHVEIETLADAAAADIHWARDVYGVLETAGQAPVERPLAALNTALAENGLVIRVTGKAPRPINLQYLRRDQNADAVVHHVIKVESGAELTLLENGPGAARLSKVAEVDIADGGIFHHVRTQGRDHQRRAHTHTFAHLGKESEFKSFTLTVNGALTRNEYVITLHGDDARAHVAGACTGDGATGAFHQDDTVFITHDAVNCESRQVYKKVLRNGATGVFQGKILVQPGAQKTDGYQISQGLLLDDDSQFLAKPELEIYADDVACSHGSTVGAIDEGAMFYLMSRGVPKSRAQELLVLAFLAEALEEIDSETIRDDIRDRLAAWIERHSG